MASEDLAPLYDARYFRTYGGAPYERSDTWLTAFRAMAAGIVKEVNPQSALDAGCAIGLMVESPREFGVEAYVLNFACREAIHDDPARHNITVKILPVDWTAVYWQRTST